MTGDAVATLQRRLDRERRARAEAERIAERTTSDLYDRQRELELLRAVATAANEASTVEHALQMAIDAMCGFAKWPVGHAWLRDERGTLVSSGLWFGSGPGAFAEFRRVTEASTFGPGRGLPGRVSESAGPVWIEDVTADDNFPRFARCATDPGVRGAFAFPVLVGDEAVAVIEMFSDRPAPPDPALVELSAQVGAHVGRVVERLRAQEKLSHAAMHDSLTGLPNRVLFLDRLELALARAARHDRLTAVMFLDLDGFKAVNDTSGHQSGDLLLREVARRLDEGLRGEDTVARLGGDEFVVLCENLQDERSALDMAERLQQLLLRPILLGPREEHLITASIGIAIAEPGQVDPHVLMSDADAAMYRAKDRGRARHEVFNEVMRDRVLTKLKTERALRRALENDELSLHFQPIVALDGREIQGAEALVRWEDPEVGMRPPSEFIPVAEESALILQLGEWVLHEACRQAALWRTDGRHRCMLPVHVNLAARQLGDARLPDVVREAVLEAGLDPRHLALEITESALIENAEVPAATLAELRSLGVRVLLDDFGTGYSSLGYLNRFPVDVLKIDRSFVAGLGDEDSSASAIVGAIVGMGHSLGIEVLAEGIETAEQAAAARRLGCDSGQGFLFARPAPVEALAVSSR